MRRTVTSFILGMALLLGFTIPASAQSVAGGVGFIHWFERNAFALNFAGDYPLMTRGNMETQVVGEFGFQFFEGTTLKTLLGGVRFANTKDAKFKPFGQVVVGTVFCCDSADFAIQFGGGVDLPIQNNKYIVRVQADVPIAFEEGESSTGFRLIASIVFPFKK